ncbi:MAG: MerR family DNA-binding protein, partial [Oscillochloris sp.]|nr:MerR family DNA-binding protein [Oscillochloris sp.]
TRVRTANNYRTYEPEDVRRLQLIASTRSLGFSLDVIGEILTSRDQGIAPCQHVLKTLDVQLEALERRIADLLVLRGDLERIRSLGMALPQDDVAGESCVCALIQTYQTGVPVGVPSREEDYEHLR